MVIGSKGRFILLSNVHMLDHSFTNAPWQSIHLDLPMSRRASSDVRHNPRFFSPLATLPSSKRSRRLRTNTQSVTLQILGFSPLPASKFATPSICGAGQNSLPKLRCFRSGFHTRIAGVSTPAPGPQDVCVCAFVSRLAATRYEQTPSSRR